MGQIIYGTQRDSMRLKKTAEDSSVILSPEKKRFIPVESLVPDPNGTILKRSKANGSFSYQAKFRQKGSKATETFDNLKDARSFLVKRAALVLSGKSPDFDRFNKIKLGTMMTSYLKGHEGDLSYGAVGRINRLITEMGELKKGDFKTSFWESWIKQKLKQEIPDQKGTEVRHKKFDGYMITNAKGERVRRTFSESTMRKYYYDVKGVLEWHAKVNDYPFDSKPFDEVSPPRAWANKRTRTVENGELEKLLKSCETLKKDVDEAKTLILFLYYSAFRVGETFLIKFKDIHLDLEHPKNSYIFIPKENQKTAKKEGAKDRKPAMRRELFDLLANVIMKWEHESENDYIFACLESSAHFYGRFKGVSKDAETFDLKIHTLRHSAISWFFQNTLLSDRDIAEITGHLDMNTLKNYAHLRPQMIGAKIWMGLDGLNN